MASWECTYVGNNGLNICGLAYSSDSDVYYATGCRGDNNPTRVCSQNRTSCCTRWFQIISLRAIMGTWGSYSIEQSAIDITPNGHTMEKPHKDWHILVPATKLGGLQHHASNYHSRNYNPAIYPTGSDSPS